MRYAAFRYMNGIGALFTLAVGYIVCILANKEKGVLKKGGLVIGIAVIAISSIIILGKAVWTAKKCTRMLPMEESAMPIQPNRISPKK
ncbi:MAG: hypothetical protein ABH806_03480 [Candidatus Omnitrophota bacterium]